MPRPWLTCVSGISSAPSSGNATGTLKRSSPMKPPGQIISIGSASANVLMPAPAFILILSKSQHKERFGEASVSTTSCETP